MSRPHSGRITDQEIRRMSALLHEAWSLESSSLWTPECPAKGQCGVTSLVMQERYGGDILKTDIEGSWHYYNRIGGRRIDFTAPQFEHVPEYEDRLSSREEAWTDTNAAQVECLTRRLAGIERELGLRE